MEEAGKTGACHLFANFKYFFAKTAFFQTCSFFCCCYVRLRAPQIKLHFGDQSNLWPLACKKACKDTWRGAFSKPDTKWPNATSLCWAETGSNLSGYFGSLTSGSDLCRVVRKVGSGLCQILGLDSFRSWAYLLRPFLQTQTLKPGRVPIPALCLWSLVSQT